MQGRKEPGDSEGTSHQHAILSQLEGTLVQAKSRCVALLLGYL